jgi:hypothetical protein
MVYNKTTPFFLQNPKPIFEIQVKFYENKFYFHALWAREQGWGREHAYTTTCHQLASPLFQNCVKWY